MQRKPEHRACENLEFLPNLWHTVWHGATKRMRDTYVDPSQEAPCWRLPINTEIPRERATHEPSLLMPS